MERLKNSGRAGRFGPFPACNASLDISRINYTYQFLVPHTSLCCHMPILQRHPLFILQHFSSQRSQARYNSSHRVSGQRNYSAEEDVGAVWKGHRQTTGGAGSSLGGVGKFQDPTRNFRVFSIDVVGFYRLQPPAREFYGSVSWRRKPNAPQVFVILLMSKRLSMKWICIRKCFYSCLWNQRKSIDLAY